MGYQGYITSREFHGQRAPQHVQNLVIRDYCNNRNMDYLLSGTEYAIPGSFLILKQLLNDLEKIDGIVAYSIFQMPEKKIARSEIFNSVIAKKKSIHFALESISISCCSDIARVEDIWSVSNIMKHVPNIQEII